MEIHYTDQFIHTLIPNNEAQNSLCLKAAVQPVQAATKVQLK